jgi:hypothetical protein
MNEIKKEAAIFKRKRTNLYKETKAAMEQVGTFRPEFEVPITRYAELRIEYDILMGKWHETGCKVTEQYTNKNGSTNERKAPVYLALEGIRRELLEMENLFGLTPKGLRVIKTKGLEDKKKGKLASVLEGLNG